MTFWKLNIKKLIFLSILMFISYSILNKIDFYQQYILIRQIDIRFWFYISLLFILQNLLSVFRWQILLSKNIRVIEYLDLLGIFFTSHFFGQFLPSSVGGDAIKIYIAKKYNYELTAVIQSVFLDRMFTVLSYFCVALFSIYLIALDGSKFRFFLIKIINLYGEIRAKEYYAFAFIFVTFAFIFYLLIKKFRKMFPYIFEIRISSSLIFVSIFINFLTILLMIISSYLICISLNININFYNCLLLFPTVFFLAALPISFNGWGIRDLATIFLLESLSIEPQDCLTISICMGLFIILGSIPGLITAILTVFKIKFKEMV